MDKAILTPKLKAMAKKICFSSEGKGRLKLLSEKHVFDYESVNDVEAKRWSLGLNIPLHGEEVLHLSWGERVAVKGAFYRRLHAGMQRAQNRDEYKKLLRSYIGQFASLIALTSEMESSAPQLKCEGGINGVCQVRGGEVSWSGLDSDSFTLTSLRDKRYHLALEASGLEGEYFRRLKIFLIDNERIGPLSTLMSMDLSLQSCQ